MLDNIQIEYFGTSFTEAGHYFHILRNNGPTRSNRRHGDLPFSPEYFHVSDEPKGTVRYVTIDCPQKSERFLIVSIAGSCSDNRGGTKSVFWIRSFASMTVYEFGRELQKHPGYLEISKRLKFDVIW